MFVFKEVKLPLNGSLINSVSKIYGVGFAKSHYLLNALGFSKLAKAPAMNLYKFAALSILLKKFYATELNLKKLIYLNLQKQILLNTYSGFRLQ